MRLSRSTSGAALALTFLLTGCGTAPSEQSQAPSQPQAEGTGASTALATTPPSASASQVPSRDRAVAGTVVHFTAGDTVVEVVIGADNPTTRSFLAMLPMTLTFSDYGGKEKVATPPGEWDFSGAAGMNPEVGDLFSYMPWGNLGFFYNTDGNTYDDSLTKIGETDDLDRIVLLDGKQVTIAVAR
ncbi:hypothetical protein ASU32_00380 [Tsukamurella tyrosinosolvens]|nr:hypothetical protein ASU32_00380 [Tsukamurella tyrosinosolvens]